MGCNTSRDRAATQTDHFPAWEENETWRRTHGWEGCIYGVPGKLPEDVRKPAIIYVIEMNNERNEIMGVGQIKNICYREQCRIYRDNN